MYHTAEEEQHHHLTFVNNVQRLRSLKQQQQSDKSHPLSALNLGITQMMDQEIASSSFAPEYDVTTQGATHDQFARSQKKQLVAFSGMGFAEINPNTTFVSHVADFQPIQDQGLPNLVKFLFKQCFNCTH